MLDLLSKNSVVTPQCHEYRFVSGRPRGGGWIRAWAFLRLSAPRDSRNTVLYIKKSDMITPMPGGSNSSWSPRRLPTAAMSRWAAPRRTCFLDSQWVEYYHPCMCAYPGTWNTRVRIPNQWHRPLSSRRVHCIHIAPHHYPFRSEIFKIVDNESVISKRCLTACLHNQTPAKKTKKQYKWKK